MIYGSTDNSSRLHLKVHDQHYDKFPIEIQDSKDTRNSSFSVKSSRHFESRSSLHVSDLAALTMQHWHSVIDEWSLSIVLILCALVLVNTLSVDTTE